MNYAIKQRLIFIEAMLDYYGYINRIILMDYFGISIPQASKDFQMYINLAPNNIIYNKNKKRYEKDCDNFEQIFLK